MRLDRREALRLGVAATALTGGCVARDTGRRPEPAPDGDVGARTEVGPEETTTPTETPTATPAPAPNPELADRTGRLVGEVTWLATEYPAAVDRAQAALREARDAGVALRTEAEVSLAETRRLRRTLREQVAVVESAFAPHFGLHNLLRRRMEGFGGTIERFARRGDDDRVREELDRLIQYLEGVASDRFYEESLPRQPINNVAVRYARRGEFVPTAPLLFQVRDVNTGFDAYAYETRPEAPTPYDLDRPAVSDAETRGLLRLFAPLRVRRGRSRETIVAFTEGETSGPGEVAGEPLVFGTQSPAVGTDRTAYVQTYDSVAAARRGAALAGARVGTDEFGESPTLVGNTVWNRVYYTFDGDVTYAYFTRAGRHLLVTGVTEVAWEERVGWGETHDRTWLAGE